MMDTSSIIVDLLLAAELEIEDGRKERDAVEAKMSSLLADKSRIEEDKAKAEQALNTERANGFAALKKTMDMMAAEIKAMPRKNADVVKPVPVAPISQEFTVRVIKRDGADNISEVRVIR